MHNPDTTVSSASVADILRRQAEVKLATSILKLCSPDMFPDTQKEFDNLVHSLDEQNAFKDIPKAERWAVAFNLTSEIREFFDNDL